MTRRALTSTVAVAAAIATGIGFLSVSERETASSAVAANPPVNQPGSGPQRAGDAVGQVTVVRPAVEDLRRATVQPAHVEPYERTDIYAKAAGYLSEVLVDIGARVKKDEVLARLWIPEMQQERVQKASLVDDARAAVEQAKSNVAAAAAETSAAEAQLAVAQAAVSQHEAEVAFRRGEHERISKLVNSRSMNEAVLDEKRNKLRAAESALAVAQAAVESAEADVQVQRSRELQAQADLKRAEAQLKVAEANLTQTETLIGYSQILTPYDGIITRRWVDTGDFVTSAANSMTQPLFTVDRDERLRIVFDVPETQASLVHVDQPATLVVDSLKGRTFKGRVRRTTGILDPKTRTLRAEVELDGNAAGLRPGMYGTITVVLTDRPQALTVPARSLRYDDGAPYVLCAAEGVVERRAVSIGYADGSRAEIVAGLSPRDLVIVDPGIAPQPGETVRVARAE